MTVSLVGMAIKKARADSKLSQPKVAIKLYKISGEDIKELRSKVVFISAIERGATVLPTSLIKDLAKILKIQTRVLVEAKTMDYRNKIIKELER